MRQAGTHRFGVSLVWIGVAAVALGVTAAAGEIKQAPPSRVLWPTSSKSTGVFWLHQGSKPDQPADSPNVIEIPSGMAAVCILDVTQADWRRYGLLAVELSSETKGRVPILFRERDPEGIECWVVPAELGAGTQVIFIRLLRQPAGDLRPALPQRDGVFNPEGEGPIDMTFLAAAGEIRIRSLTLRSGNQ